MEKSHNFNAESIVSKWLWVDNSGMVEHFYSSTTVPFIKALIVEKKRCIFTRQSTSIKSNDMLESW